jgi:hypothetical protein
MKLADLNINVADNQGNLRDINEIINELQKLYDDFDTRSMNDHELYLEGEKNMISSIITYLKRI